MHDITTELAPRVVKIKNKPQNGRSSLPKGIVKHAQHGSFKEAPQVARSLSKDAVPRDVLLTDMSGFLASDKISECLTGTIRTETWSRNVTTKC
jgi:hypothetical protein